MSDTYVYDNKAAAATAHHEYLSAILDTHTKELLSGLRLHPGSRCLEVGAGAGSIASWLATKVAPHGQVVATDIAPLPMPMHPCLDVQQHNIVTEPVPEGPWNLIHARLLLVHLPEQREVLRKLAAALAPHGALVVEDWDMTWEAWRVLHAPTPADATLFERFQNALWLSYTAGDETRRGWASQVPAEMAGAGLVDISAQYHTQSWVGGSNPAARLLAGNIIQLRDQLRAHGLTGKELQRMRELMASPNMMWRMSPMVSTTGYARRGPGVA